ncbi:ABC transporter permease [[Clostridium] hylemonae]|uniref:ABC transporter permease n=1 Tax=[Clostridium] hylemonae TaxID=89153 RepID=UPI001106F70F|nr:ABC transporter permease [[Clostridium] hylemonae]
MYILKNAFQNLYRNAGRNLLTAGIFLLVITMSCVALVIYNDADAIAKQYRERLSTEVLLNVDEKKVSEAWEKDETFRKPELTDELIQKMAASKYLKKAMYSTQMEAVADNLKYTTPTDYQDMEIQRAGEDPAKTRIPQYTLSGYEDVSQAEPFRNGQAKLAEGGTFPAADNECLVSDTLAELNGLKPGDTFPAKSIYYTDKQGGPLEEMTLKVSGIYHRKYSEGETDSDNEIFTRYKLLTDPRYTYEPTFNTDFYLKNPRDLHAFAQEAYAAGLSEYYSLSTDTVAYDAFVRPIEQMCVISMIFLWVVLVLGAAILLILSSLLVRERKYEIGVLRAMGMKKSKVAAQLVLESALTMAVCLILGIALGSLLAQPVTDMLLADQMSRALSGPTLAGGMGGTSFGGLATDNRPVTHISAALSLTAISELTAIALFLTAAAGAVSAACAMKYEPMRILRHRN